MDRLPTAPGYAAAITAGLEIIPERMRRLVHVEFLCGVDPVFAGLHTFADIPANKAAFAESGTATYAEFPHCVYRHHQLHKPRDQRATTIVLPTIRPPSTIVHEFGHALHEVIGFDYIAEPVTEYAATDKYEAFAEAVCSWLFWGYPTEPDQRTAALLDGLGRA